MAYCSECGEPLGNGMKFCPNCGKPVTARTGIPVEAAPSANGPVQSAPPTPKRAPKQREEVWSGAIHKCPNCGQVLDAFEATCPSCGHELRGAVGATSLATLFSQLQMLNSMPDGRERHGFFSRVARITPRSADQAASLIRAFPIPNTKEDLIEFIVISASNVNEDTFNDFKAATFSPTEAAMSRAWAAKLEQAYQKAQITICNDPDFADVKTLYEKKTKRIKWAKRSMLRFWIGLALVWAVLIVICLVGSQLSPTN